jgi:hypothetical protein
MPVRDRAVHLPDAGWFGWALSPAPRRPSVVLAAGVIWIAAGSLALANLAVNVLLIIASPQPKAQVEELDKVIASVVAVAFFCGFFVPVGVQTISGGPRDILGNAICSFFIALFVAVIGPIAVLTSLLRSIDLPSAIQVAVNLCLCAGLVAAGVLALVGRERYCAWRRALRTRSGRDQR